MSPAVLKATMGDWLSEINASVVAPDEATYISAGYLSTIDYFVLHNWFLEGAPVATLEFDKVTKHLAVVFSLPGVARKRLVHIILKMPRLPTKQPIGCVQALPPIEVLDDGLLDTIDESQLEVLTKRC